MKNAINSGNYKAGSVAFALNPDGSAKHVVVVGTSTKDNIFYWAHTNNRNGYDTSGAGLKYWINQGDRIAIYTVKYDTNMR